MFITGVVVYVRRMRAQMIDRRPIKVRGKNGSQGKEWRKEGRKEGMEKGEEYEARKRQAHAQATKFNNDAQTAKNMLGHSPDSRAQWLPHKP
jgi:hypothetical protein